MKIRKYNINKEEKISRMYSGQKKKRIAKCKELKGKERRHNKLTNDKAKQKNTKRSLV